MKRHFRSIALPPVPFARPALAEDDAFIRAEHKHWSEVIRAAGNQQQ